VRSGQGRPQAGARSRYPPIVAGRRGKSRRQVLGAVGAVSAGALVVGVVGRGATPHRDTIDRRGPDGPLPFLTPTAQFYKFTNSNWPSPLHPSEAQLSVGGPTSSRTVPWAELLSLPTRRLVRTLSCDGNGYLGETPPRHLGCQMGATPDPEESSDHPEPELWSWRYGGIGTAEWDVMTIPDLFAALSMPLTGSHLRIEGRDGYLRWFPIERTRGDELLIAVGMNGTALPHKHGAPARLLASGQYGAMSVKWLRAISVGSRTGARPFDGGSREDFEVKPIAFASGPIDGGSVPRGSVQLVGAAYSGRQAVKQVLVGPSGEDPVVATLLDPGRPYVWSRWSAEVQLHQPGDVVVQIACSDSGGRYSTVQSPWGDAQGFGGLHRLHLTVT